ncbi:MAG: sulfatase [Acidobacteria bacterium]|nr:sulfatase [Acidobacteriota bacterium]
MVFTSARRPRLRHGLLLLVLFALPGCSPREPGDRVVLITLDTLRFDAVEGGEGRPTAMPKLKAWGDASTTFDHCFSATSTTQPSHASMLTGLHPWQHGLTRNGQRLPAELETVAEHLKAAGWSTSAVVASFPLSAVFGFDQGFDHYDDHFDRGQPGTDWRGDAETVAHEDGEEDEDGGAQTPQRFYSLSDSIVDRALALLDDTDAPRQFLWFHFFDAHAPYGDTGDGPTVTPSQILDRAEEGENVEQAIAESHDLYDLDLRFLDQNLARLLERLDEQGDRYRTHVVILADHGESFGEDGSLAHGRRLTPGQIHVPCMIRSSLLELGHRSDVVGSIDVADTVLGLAGVDGSVGHGRDLTRPLDRPARAFGMRRTYRKPYLDRRLDGSVVVLDHNLFYLADRDGRIYRGNAGMLLAPEPGTALPEELQKQLSYLFTTFEDELAGRAPQELTDDETRKALESLGYTG